MTKHKIVEIYLKHPETEKILSEKYSGKFTSYIEDRMDEYVMQGWNIIQPNLVYNGFGSIHKVILLMVKEIKKEEKWIMAKSKGVSPSNNNANMQNANKGTQGVNKQYSQVQGNRGSQLNPNNKNK